MRRGLLVLLLLAGCASSSADSVRMPSFSMEPNIEEGARVRYEPVASAADIATFIEGGDEKWGKPGDVVLYFPANDRDRPSPIVHRAMAYVDVRPGEARPFWVRWGTSACEGDSIPEMLGDTPWCTYGPDGLVAPSITIEDAFVPRADGFFTKGDHTATNPRTDQESGLSRDAAGEDVPVPLGWILGRATRVS